MTYSNIKSIVSQVIGTYNPVTTGEGAGTIDFVWIVSAIIFIIFIAYFFKFLFRLFNK